MITFIVGMVVGIIMGLLLLPVIMLCWKTVDIKRAPKYPEDEL